MESFRIRPLTFRDGVIALLSLILTQLRPRYVNIDMTCSIALTPKGFIVLANDETSQQCLLDARSIAAEAGLSRAKPFFTHTPRICTHYLSYTYKCDDIQFVSMKYARTILRLLTCLRRVCLLRTKLQTIFQIKIQMYVLGSVVRVLFIQYSKNNVICMYK